MTIEITQQFVVYTGQTRLAQLGKEIAQSRSLTKPEILAKRQLATKIRLWLKALNDDYASRATREKIWYALVDIGNLIDIPFAPVLTTNQPPTILVGIAGPRGGTGSTGATGGGVSFSSSNVSTDSVVDSFDTSLSTAAEWSYEVYDSSNKRVERLTGGWLSGVSTDDGGLATTDIGDTSAVTFSTNISGSTVQLIAHVSSGAWTIRGTRQLIPVSGNGITQPTSLSDGKIWIGDSTNQPASRTLSGDVTVTDTGVTSISSGVIVNADVNSSAAIVVSKLAALTASKAVVTDSSGFLATSTSAASKVDYLANVTSDIQTQIDTIAAAGSITGAITPYVTTNATINRVVISNGAGKFATSTTTSTELGYSSGVTSAIQTQINSKQASLGYTPVNKAGDTMSGVLAMGSNKISGLAAASVNGDAVRFEQLPNVSTTQIPFSTGTSVFGGDSNLTWDNTNKNISTKGLIVNQGNTYFKVVSSSISLSANTDNYNLPVGTSFRITCIIGGPFNLSGLQNGTDGRIVILKNFGAPNVNLLHENAGSSGANRFFFSTGGTIALGTDHQITLMYDSNDSRWIDISMR